MTRKERIEDCLKKVGLKKKDLAERLGKDARYISAILKEPGTKNSRNPKIETWHKMSNILKTSVDYLKYGIEDEDEQRLLNAYRHLKAMNRGLAEKGIEVIETFGQKSVKKASNDN